MAYCKKHKKTKLVEEHYGCEYCGDVDIYCPKCEEEKEKEEQKKIKKTCNYVVEIGPDTIIKNKILVKFGINNRIMTIRHNNKRLKKGSRAIINEDGYIEYCPSGNLLVVG